MSNAFASKDETEKELKNKKQNEKIISIFKKGIKLMKYEIQRDEEVASRKIRIPGLRQLRLTLKKDISAKENLLNDLKLLPPTSQNKMGALQNTLDQEKKIAQGAQTSSRVRRVTRGIIKGMVPVKKNILASFEKGLSE